MVYVSPTNTHIKQFETNLKVIGKLKTKTNKLFVP